VVIIVSLPAQSESDFSAWVESTMSFASQVQKSISCVLSFEPSRMVRRTNGESAVCSSFALFPNFQRQKEARVI
jgi:hypothetical protein